MVRSPKPPATPQFVSPGPYQSPGPFQAPAPYVAPPNPNGVIPKVLTPQQLMTQGQQVEGMLPQWLQLNQNPLDPNGRKQYEDYFYQTQIAPLLAQQEADSYANGQNSGSYAGGQHGALQAQGALSKYQAGLDYAQQLFNNMLQGRQSYYAGGPTVSSSQNAADVARGSTVAGLQSQNAANQNQYNLGLAGMANNYNLSSAGGQNQYNLSSAGMHNGFNQQNYSNAYGNYLQQLQNQANRFGAIGGGISSIFGGLGSLAGMGFRGSFGGSGGGSGGGIPGLGSGAGYSGVIGTVSPMNVGGFGGAGLGNPYGNFA